MNTPSDSASQQSDTVAARPRHSFRRLLVMLSVLGIAGGLLWWQKKNQPLKPNLNATPRELLADDVEWQKAVDALNAELKSFEPAATAFLKERSTRLLAGQFELPLDAHNTATFQKATADVRRLELATYRERTTELGDARDKSIAFFEAYFHEIEFAIPISERASRQLGQEALQAGASDSLFQVYRIVGEFVADNTAPELIVEMEAELDKLSASKTYSMATFIGRRWLSNLATQGVTDRKAERFLATIKALKLFAPPLTADPLESRVKQVLIKELYRSADSHERRRIIIALTETPGVDPWLRHQFMGMLQINEGWSIRGSGYASTVSESQWKGFGEHIDRAAKHLICAWHLHPKFPESPTEMITVGKADSKHLPGRFWFFEAAWAQPDYFLAYNHYLSDLLPRWGGSHEQMVDFGRRCVRTGRYDMNVPQYLLYVLSSIGRDIETQEEGGKPDGWLDVEGALTTLRQLHDEMKQRKNSSGTSLLETTTQTNRSSLAKYLAVAEDYKRVVEVLDLGGDADDASHYESREFAGTAIRALWRGLAGPHAVEYRSLNEVFLKFVKEPDIGPSPTDLQAQAQALREQDPSEQTKPLFNFVNQRIELRLAFDRGDWVPLPVTGTDTHLWWYWRDWMRFPEDDVVEVGGNKEGNAIQMALRVRFPVPYEFEAGLEQIGERLPRAPVGLLIGDHHHVMRNTDRTIASMTLFTPNISLPREPLEGVHVGVRHGGAVANPSTYVFRPNANARVGVMVWPTRLVPVWQGATQVVGQNTMDHFVGTGEIAIGQLAPRGKGAAQMMRVSKPRIRKLPFGPPPAAAATSEEQQAYFEQVVQAHPGDASAHKALYFLWRERDRVRAMLHLERALKIDPERSDLHQVLAWKHFNNHDFSAALQEFETEFRLTAASFYARSWLVKLLLCHPDETLRNAKRALQIFDASEMLKVFYGSAAEQQLAYVRPMVLAERGDFDEALKALDQLEPKIADDELEQQLVAQQRAAYQQRKPFRLQPRSLKRPVSLTNVLQSTPSESDVPSALQPANGSHKE